MKRYLVENSNKNITIMKKWLQAFLPNVYLKKTVCIVYKFLSVSL